MTLHLRARLSSRDLDVDLSVADGERVAILGPNGSGKSTLLSVVAGVLRPDSGLAELDGRVLFDLGDRETRPRARHWTPPYDRGAALLAQDALLFPHLSVLDNVAFGPRSAGQPARLARTTARRWLEEVGAAEFAGRRPAELSGGQAQRVAIARALAAEPRMLLLDEPMAALDVAAAPTLRRVLRRVLDGRSALIVTHDLLDALLLAHRVVVLDGGRIVESGPTQEVIAHPRTVFTARIAGLNLVRGTAEEGGVRRMSGELFQGGVAGLEAGSDGAEALVRHGAAIAVFSPSAVAVYLEAPHGSPRNTLAVTVTELEPREHLVRIRADDRTGQTFTADVTAAAVGELDLYPGRTVHYAVKATAVTIYPS
ncbi:MAG: sulfate/molybdate ABC transporter ATP-binding protein [Propionibacteriaceae bacterium]